MDDYKAKSSINPVVCVQLFMPKYTLAQPTGVSRVHKKKLHISYDTITMNLARIINEGRRWRR